MFIDVPTLIREKKKSEYDSVSIVKILNMSGSTDLVTWVIALKFYINIPITWLLFRNFKVFQLAVPIICWRCKIWPKLSKKCHFDLELFPYAKTTSTNLMVPQQAIDAWIASPYLYNFWVVWNPKNYFLMTSFFKTTD